MDVVPQNISYTATMLENELRDAIWLRLNLLEKNYFSRAV